MKEQLYEILKYQGDLTWQMILVNVVMSAVIGMVIYVSYAVSHRGTIYSKKFNVSLIVLTILTCTVMTVIGNNIALSLGMVGALSIVRFRTAIKDSRDTVYIFWTIIVGICCGVQNFFVASIGSAVVFLVLLVLGSVKSDSRMLLIIRGDRQIELDVESLVFKRFGDKVVLRVKNTTTSHIEFIYELSEKILKKVMAENPNLTSEFYAIGQVEFVNMVMQNDEISN